MWILEIGRINILLEVSLTPTHLSLTREGKIEQVIHIFGYIDIQKNTRLILDCGYPLIGPNIFN